MIATEAGHRTMDGRRRNPGIQPEDNSTGRNAMPLSPNRRQGTLHNNPHYLGTNAHIVCRIKLPNWIVYLQTWLQLPAQNCQQNLRRLLIHESLLALRNNCTSQRAQFLILRRMQEQIVGKLILSKHIVLRDNLD